MSIFTTRIFIVFIIFLFALQTEAQDMGRVRQHMQQLCSEAMHGRGYISEGDRKAADYIADAFQTAGLKAFQKESFLQYFEISVNTFPGLLLQIDGKTLEAGSDYIIQPISQGGRAQGNLLYITQEVLDNPKAQKRVMKSIKSDYVLVFDETLQSRIFENIAFRPILQKTKAIIVLKAKLTASMAQEAHIFPIFEVLKTKFPKKAKNINFEVKQEVLKNYRSQNVIGYVEGRKHPDKFFVFTAHYDHLGRLGEAYFPGANDNASGTVMLIELAHYFSQNPPDHSVVFMAFGAEEVALLGSRYYVENPYFPLEDITFLFNMDIFGTGKDGATVVNATIHPEIFEKLKAINKKGGYLPQILPREPTANSDHYFFSQKGVPAFFMYLMDSNYTHYHDVEDTYERVTLSHFDKTYHLLIGFAEAMME
ncbi:MAG: M20/M25/M40 family metallo-hydrolase [Bernardetiaceae bacterium]|nr:M20/M25/M40 family metallo-hydrolase [Bernardetiaceae bacterium]